MRGKWIAVLAAASVTLVACGGSSSSDDGAAGGAATTPAPAIEAVATTVAAPPTTQAPTTTEAAEPEVTDGLTESTEVPVDDTFPPLDTQAAIDTDFSGEGSGPFCDFVRELDDTDPVTAAFDATDPAVAKAAWLDVTSTFDKLEDLAPDEVSGDVTALASAFDMMQQFFEGFEYDIQAASLAMENEPEMVALFSGEDTTIQDASDRLDAYGTEVCGLAS